jgi:dihydroflavonol-4-reductase
VSPDIAGNGRSVVVTGGTGFLGEHLVRALVAERRHRVRVLARTRSPVLEDLRVECIRGDVLEGGELDSALRDCAAVFHLAGLVSRDPDDGQRMMRLHVDGTRRVLERAAAAGVRRIVVASTSGTVAVSPDEVVLDERSGYATEVVAGWPYYASKIYQEKLAFDLGAKLGLEIVCVNPSLLLGPGDRRLSSTGDVRRFLKGQIPVVPKGGMNFVDARDAAAATLAALEKGVPGERYLLGGPNWTMKEFFARLGRVAKVSPPRLRLPSRLQRATASLVEDLYRRRGKEPPIDRISVEMSEHFWWFDSAKAERALGFRHRDPALTLGDTVSYIRQGVDVDL